MKSLLGLSLLFRGVRVAVVSIAMMAVSALPAIAQSVNPAPSSKKATAPVALPATAVATGKTGEAKTGDEAVVLSPFEVVADDNGYQAFNTLSGTRLNSKLEDLGSSITVVTKQQMTDLGLLDINDVFRYEASTEGTDTYTTFNRNRSGGVNDQVQSDPAQANRIRGINAGGQSAAGANTAWGNFSSNSKIPFDPYNIDAVEISRGPNSNLFGLGAASGTVNVVPTQANTTRQSFKGDLRFDSWGGRRESLNLNVPIFRGKLALRVAAVEEAKGFTRKPSSDRIHREYATVLARPIKGMTVRLAAERYHSASRRPNSITPRDTTTEWRAAGSPTWDPTTQMVTLANGTRTGPLTDAQLPAGLIANFNGFYARSSFYADNTGFLHLTPMRGANLTTTGFPTNPFGGGGNAIRYLQSSTELMKSIAVVGRTGKPLFVFPGTSDKSIYDWSKYNAVSANRAVDQAKTATAEIEQILVNSPQNLVAVRIGAFQQKFSRDAYTMIDNAESIIYVDVNEKLLDGRPNPFFKRPYIAASTPNIDFRPSNSAIFTADLAYQILPAKLPRWLSWIGLQRFGAHAERNNTDTWAFNYIERAADPTSPWINPAVPLGNTFLGAQVIAKRYYVGDNQGQNFDYGLPAQDYIVGTFPLTWFNSRTGQWTETPTKIDRLLSTGSAARTRTEIRTINATSQNFFFNNRLVTTVGWRRDRQRNRTGATSFVNPTTGLAEISNQNIFGPLVGYTTPAGIGPINLPGWVEMGGDTKTYGAVAKPLRWLNVHVNKSDSFTPQAPRMALDGTGGNAPNPRGFATEWGASFSLLKNKLNIRLNRFQTKELNARGSEISTLGNRYLDMEGRPDGANANQLGSVRYFATQVVLRRLAAQGNQSPTSPQLDPLVAQFMGLSPEMYTRMVYSGAALPQTIATTDTSSKGFELEATYNPTRNWRVKLTGSQTRAQDDRVGTEIMEWWLKRVPIWENARSDIVPGDGRGPNWWNNIPVGQRSDTPYARWVGEQWGPFQAASTNVGRPRSQIREYRFAGLTNYEFSEGRLKGFSIGGAARYESKASVGFLAAAPEASGPYQGAVLFLDTTKPIWGKAQTYFDLSSSYRYRIHGDKIRGRVQLNVRNVFEDGRLQAVGVNPDGVPYALRIVDPRQFIFSLSFEL
jgi:outer membrane receptor protein involved in Fe transport